MTIKENILLLLGENNTTPAVFKSQKVVGAVYTWKKNVYCLVDGMDIEFENIKNIKDQESILESIINKDYEFDDSYQG